MPKQLLHGDEARAKLLEGARKLKLFVVTTLGPKGRNIALDRKWTDPVVYHDGVKIAKDIELEDPFENMGAQLIKEAASKSADDTGDGTTTATLLAYSLLKDGSRAIAFDANPMSLIKGVQKAIDVAVEEIKRLSKPIRIETQELEQVATVSAANPELGKIIAEAIRKVGKEGLVTDEEGAMGTQVEYKMGMEFDKGYASAYFVTNQEKIEAEINDALVVVTDEKLSSSSQIIAILENSIKALDNKNIMIVAEEISGDALATLIINNGRGVISALPVPAPLFADRKKQILEDIAILTGATLISKDAGLSIEKIQPSHVGRADKVWANAEKTRIVGGKGSKEAIDERVKQIKNQIKETTSDFDREKLQERLAKLVGGVAVIKVGAPTEQEMKEKRERVNDAIGATKSALQEGIVAGGGITLLQASKALPALIETLSGDQKLGAQIVESALKEPIKKIIENAGGDSGVILSQIEKEGKENYGYDVETETFGDMLEKGIIDPAKVVRSALQNAGSVSMTMLTTEGLVSDLPEKEPKDQSPMM